MSAEIQPSLRLEIGHVLFIDIVGYSKLLINEQSEMLQTLNEVVRGTEQARAADRAGKLIRLPSGDGMALVFRDRPEAPAQCALEICAALKSRPEVRVRMGIKSGPVNEIVDVNERANIAGGGINLAQRIMDCGDADHILLSKRVADDLAQYREWQPRLHDLGECEVKHGMVVSVVNLHTGDLGNPAVPTKLQQHREARSAPKVSDATRQARRRKDMLTGLALVMAFALPIAYWFYKPPIPKGTPTSGTSPSAALATLPEKRIAVLPFKPLTAENRDLVLELGMADTLIAKLGNSREVRMGERNYPEAIVEFKKARDFSGGNSEAISMIGYVAAIAGDRAQAEAVLAELNSLSTQRYVPPHNIAVLHLGLAQLDECFAWLEKAYEDHDVRLSFLRVDPKWDPVRSDPRFISILKRIGLD